MPTTERIDTERIDTERIDTERIDTERIDTERIDTERIDTERIDTERIDTQRTKSAGKTHVTLSPSLYFAYGSNLNVKQMMARCPTAQMLGSLTLPDWRLEFRAVADIAVCPGAEVVGALYRVQEQDVLALDRYEGYRRSNPEGGLYRKVYRKAEDVEGRINPFMFYVMNAGALWPPQAGYLSTIRQGYEDWGLPAASLEEAVLRSEEAARRQWPLPYWGTDEAASDEPLDGFNEELTGSLFGEEW